MTAQATQPKILIAEDELIVAENIARHLKQQGYKVIAIVDSGEAAIDEAAKGQPDLILMDIMLQGEVDGVAATTAINTQLNLPVIYMTAYADDATLERAKLTNPYGYLVKPFKPDDLKICIEIALQKHRADTALHIEYITRLRDAEAKINYFNSIVCCKPFTESFAGASTHDLSVEIDLRRGLQQQEFHLVYQPRVNLKSGQITGVEALVRWQHPIKGAISPAQFIPLAEATGVIEILGDWVLKTACQQLKTWQQAGLPSLTIAVNLSGYQLKQPRLAQQICHILEETELDPQLVELELTESTLIEDIDLASQQLHRLKNMGLQIAMDDFGTGYSCLSHLHRLPFDSLKLDRSFVRGIDRNYKNAAIAVAIISMSQQLDLRVVAEGVETYAELSFLYNHNCDEMQGFLFSKPLPPTEFKRLILSDERLWSSLKTSCNPPQTM